MNLYKRCIFHFHFSTVWRSVHATGNYSALCIGAWKQSRLCIDDWTYWSVWSRWHIKMKCLCGSGTDSKVSLTIIQVHAVTSITDISWKHCFNTQKTGEIIRQSSQNDTNLCIKCTKIRLAAGLGPDLLGELKRSPRPPSRNRAYF